MLRRVRVASLGAVAQLGERLVRNEEVSGSIPLSSTRKINNFLQKSGNNKGKESSVGTKWEHYAAFSLYCLGCIRFLHKN